MCNSLREGKLPSCSNESELHAPDVVNMTFQLINTNFPGGLRVSTNESVSLLFVPLSILFTRIVSVFSWCYGGNSFPLRTLKPDWITYVQLRRFSLPKRAGLPVYISGLKMPFSQKLSPSAQGSSPRWTPKTTKKEDFSPLMLSYRGLDSSALLPCSYMARLKEQSSSKFVQHFDSKCLATPLHASDEHIEVPGSNPWQAPTCYKPP